MDKLIGNRISQARKAKHLTQENLAEITGLSVSAISRIETGKNSTSLKTLCKFCDALNIGLDYLLYDILPYNFTEYDPLTIDIISLLNNLDNSQKQIILDVLTLYVSRF